jgi:AcrR family transcriptional regulator
MVFVMPRPRNLQAREETAEAIKAAARQQMAENGTAGISLRGIARELGMTAPALYNYFPRLDDLITALIIDAFNGLGDAVEEAVQSAEEPAQQLKLGMNAYRDWALAHPSDFQLIYGNPIPNYQAPADVTVPLAARPLQTMYHPLAAAYQAGDLLIPEAYAEVPHNIKEHVSNYLCPRFPELCEMPMSIFYLIVVGWSKMHGVVMLEIFEHIGPTIGDVDTFFNQEIDIFLKSLGLKT